MLGRIPSTSPKELNDHFNSINSKLSAYKGTKMLELAIWKSKIEEQTNEAVDVLNADMKMEWCINSLWKVDFIVPIVLSFLRGNANEGDDDDDDDGDDDKDDRDDEYSDDNNNNNDNDDDKSDKDDGDDQY